MRFHHLWPLLLLLIPLGYLYGKRRELLLRPLADRLAILLRFAALGLVLLALCGPQILSRVEAHYVYFLLDRSASTRSAAPESELIERLNAWAAPQPHTQYGLIVFGAQPFVEVPFSPTLDLREIHTTVDPEGTDLAAAIELALETFPEGGTKTILLLSDGRATQGDLSKALVRAAREGVRIFTLPLLGPQGEVSVLDLRLPQEVAVGLPFRFQSVIYASSPTEAQLLISRDGELLKSQKVFLRAGLNFIEEESRLPQPGVYEYQIRVRAPADALTPNNTYRALVEAVGEPRLLLVETEEELRNGSPLEKLLKLAGYRYHPVALKEFAPTTASLLPLSLITHLTLPTSDLV